MSNQTKNENYAVESEQKLTNWQKIDQLEAELERKKPQKKRRGGMKFRRIFGDTVGQIVLTVLSIIWIIPLIYLLIQSFRKEPGAWSPTFFPQQWTLDNYKRLFTETKFLQWYGNTLVIAICSCIITALFVLSVAYAFSRMKFKARKPMMNVMLILGMFPGFMSMIAIYFILKAMGLANSLFALILVYSGSAALSYYICKGFFDTLPRALEEAALLDGASQPVVFLRIILPMSKPIIVYTVLTSFISPWCDFIFVNTIISDRNLYTVSLGLYKMINAEKNSFNDNFTVFCAGSFIVGTIIVALFMSMQRYYVEGVTSGAVKG